MNPVSQGRGQPDCRATTKTRYRFHGTGGSRIGSPRSVDASDYGFLFATRNWSRYDSFLVGLIAPMLISYDLRSRAYLLYFSRPLGSSITYWERLSCPLVFPSE